MVTLTGIVKIIIKQLHLRRDQFKKNFFFIYFTTIITKQVIQIVLLGTDVCVLIFS